MDNRYREHQAHEIFPCDKYKEPYCSKKNIEELAKNSETIFVCVPTPMKPSGEMDYSAIYDSLDFLTEEAKNKERNLEEILIASGFGSFPSTDDRQQTL